MSATEHLTLSKDELPLPSTAEGILGVIRNVLNKPFVQTITLSQGSPIQVTWYRDLSDSLQIDEPDEQPDSVLARISIDELSGEFSPKELLIDGMMLVSAKGEYPSHLLVGNIDSFRDCLGIPRMVPLPPLEGTKYPNFIGVPLVEVGGLHKDAMVLLSSGVRNGTFAEVKSGLKLSL
jgi:hypothetical protein